ncbi:ribokinase [Rubidibacter lacunae KORDI 51-2]|uniref:Ribokinase n=1 Tax=Rubidibacter lacunae KORDI 51-2 TaxID=582515 RepID=U5DNW6_9CHRO|nr:ribokinase [Rubidibacter lacunae]ERN41400.1 ribokinase [Rubidibacter lacunae KORDI 51-2]
MNSPHVVVFGSLNADLVMSVPHLPQSGETLLAGSFTTVPGGKGANQAAALARLNVPTTLVGRVGDDDFGRMLQASLKHVGADTSGVAVDPDAPTGLASIAVATGGENHIIVVPGANNRLDASDIARLRSFLDGAAMLLLQLEVPLSAAIAAAQSACDLGVPVLLDPAPARALPPELYAAVDAISPNATEAEVLVGFAVTDSATAARAADVLLQRGVGLTLMTLGEQGVYCATAREAFFAPAFPIAGVDTVAAGDAFNGAYAAARFHGLDLQRAVTWGQAAGAIAASRPGSQSSLPTADELRSFLSDRGISFGVLAGIE